MEWIYNYCGLSLANAKTDYFLHENGFLAQMSLLQKMEAERKDGRGGNENCSKVVLVFLYLTVLLAGA